MRTILAEILAIKHTLPTRVTEARKLKVKWFYTGKPCKNQHVAPRLTSSGTCMFCHNASVKKAYEKDPEPFKIAAMQSYRKQKEADPEGVKERNNKSAIEWRKANIEKARAQDRTRYAANIEQERADDRAYYAANIENERQRRRDDYAKDPKGAYIAWKRWADAHPEHMKAKDRNSRARKRGAEGKHTKDDINQIRIEQLDKCAFCFIPLCRKGHVDPIMPLVRGGSNWPSNLELLCVSCNSTKRDKTLVEFSEYMFQIQEKKRMAERVALRPARVVEARVDTKPATSGAVVCVALKMPNGLKLDGFVEVARNEATPIGFREVTEWQRTGESFVLRGNAFLADLQRRGAVADTGGYAITKGVPEDLWLQWYKFNQNSALVRNGLIFACDSEEDCAIEGLSRSSIRSGMEPVDPEHPELTTGMVKRDIGGGRKLSGIEAAERPA